MRGHEGRKKLKELLPLNRTRRKATQFNPGGIRIGEHANTEERASTTENGIQIDEIEHVFYLDCGCIGSPDSVKAICDFCERGMCSNCSQTCIHCGLRGCRYCVKEYVIDGQRVLLCKEGYLQLKRSEIVRKVSVGVLGIFVKREE
jgi:hypothetical protein